MLNFKNHAKKNLDFSPSINCFFGNNGVGKTNMLDAIYYLCITKSAFNHSDRQSIRHGQDFLMIKGNFTKLLENFDVLCTFQSGKKKILRVNQQQYDYLSEHIGNFPCVMISPDDVQIIKEGSEMRRRFFDGVICQINRHYLRHLLQYNRMLKQRNSLLKQFAERNTFDEDLLASYNLRLITHGQPIHEQRKTFIEKYIPVFQGYYSKISETKEKVELLYTSTLHTEDFYQSLKKSLEKDRVLQRTNMGIHRDDFDFYIDGYLVKKYASQGQQKSYCIAMKLAQHEVIKKNKGFTPILLMDDLFDKLDDRRIRCLVQIIATGNLGQIFLTDSRPERTRNFFSEVSSESKFFIF